MRRVLKLWVWRRLHRSREDRKERSRKEVTENQSREEEEGRWYNQEGKITEERLNITRAE